MTEVALLNRPVEALVASEMVHILEARLQYLEGVLANTLLEREAYLQTFGKATEARDALSEIRATYRRNFKE